MGSNPSQPPTHRRMASLKQTTMSWLKGTRSSSSMSAADRSRGIFSAQTSPTRPEYNISEPIPFTFDDATGQDEFGRDIPRTMSPRAVEQSRGRASIGLDRLVEESRQNLSAGRTDVREKSPALSRMSESDKVFPVEDPNAPKHAKKKGVKLKMALSLLRRRSNSNLRGKSEERRSEDNFRGMDVSVHLEAIWFRADFSPSFRSLGRCVQQTPDSTPVDRRLSLSRARAPAILSTIPPIPSG